jgi:hypothetical protein
MKYDTPARSPLWPLHRWACTCRTTAGECPTCIAWATPGAAGAIAQRAAAIRAARRQMFAEFVRPVLDQWGALR